MTAANCGHFPTTTVNLIGQPLSRHRQAWRLWRIYLPSSQPLTVRHQLTDETPFAMQHGSPSRRQECHSGDTHSLPFDDPLISTSIESFKLALSKSQQIEGQRSDEGTAVLQAVISTRKINRQKHIKKHGLTTGMGRNDVTHQTAR